MKTEIFIKNKIIYGEKEQADDYCEFVATRKVDNGFDEEIRVRLNDDGTLYINSNYKLKISPVASDTVSIDFSK